MIALILAWPKDEWTQLNVYTQATMLVNMCTMQSHLTHTNTPFHNTLKYAMNVHAYIALLKHKLKPYKTHIILKHVACFMVYVYESVSDIV